MKLLKYVMTTDSGLAPNPFFGVCSLALCTPNHMNAKLEVGDWVVGHSSRKQGNKLVYAMRLTKILDMPSYFAAFPEKRPNPTGSLMEQCGDNLYDYQGGQWTRLPSACHNNVDIFKQDQGHPVFLAEGEDNFWYFGGDDNPLARAFNDYFPELIKDRQGFSYERNGQVIARFETWLRSLDCSGAIGSPRDLPPRPPGAYLVQIEPEERWVSSTELGTESPRKSGISCSAKRPTGGCSAMLRKVRNGCS